MRYSTRSIIVALTLFIAAHAQAEQRVRQQQKGPFRNPANGMLESIEEKKLDSNYGGRSLASGDDEDDISHYHGLARNLGIDLGIMVPMGDFKNTFGTAAMIGMHLNWQAIPPFSLVVSMQRSSAPQKDTVNTNGKLTVSNINIGAQASFPRSRFVPYVKVEGSFHFNTVNFNDGRRILSGDDLNITTVGVNAGLGIDFVVAREMSFGLDITCHYGAPKRLSLSDGSFFDLGSPYVTTGIRVNF